ncbi:30S ribosomal protein S27ae [Candidatus Woesearchaeota archaeon]|nr:30S ribosomal protein S27ae [Candidatus Woesearchaeota archaeon]
MADAKPAKKSVVKPRSKLYDGGKVKNRSCPKCGEGFLLAEHKERRTCGKCLYVESKK